MKTLIGMLIMVTGAASAGFQILHEQVGGSPMLQCMASQVNDFVYYSGQDCEVHMYQNDLFSPMPGSPPLYQLDLGNCNNQVTKVILDSKMYKVDYDISFFKTFSGNEPEIYIENDVGTKIQNCYSPSGIPPEPDYPLVLILTKTFDIFILKSLIFGTDQYNKPVVIMESVSGDIVCDGYSKVVTMIDMDDLIFKDGF